MKHPLVPVALLFAAGVILAEWFSPSTFGLLAAVGLLILGTILWTRARRWLVCALALVAGAANLSWRTESSSPFDLRRLMDAEPRLVTLRGTLAETPRYRIFDPGEAAAVRTLAVLEAGAVRWEKQPDWQPARGRVAITTSGELAGDYFFRGRQVEVFGVLRQPRMPRVEGTLDYRTHLRHRGIYFQLQAESPAAWELIPDAAGVTAPPAPERFNAWARQMLRRGLPAEDEAVQLLWAMTLGWRTALTGEVAERFMRTGTMHIFAISGLHIALIAGMLVSLLRVLRMPRAGCGLVVIPALWFYTAATGWQPSAIRATIMMSVVVGGWALRRPSQLLNSLAAAGLLILVSEPRQLFQAGFQLSFFVVLSLALFGPWFDAARRRLLAPDPFRPLEVWPRWQRWLREAAFWIATGLTTSLAAWLGSAPLIAHYFHLFTPVSLLGNLLIVPLAGLALAGSLGSLLVTAWWPAAGELFNHAAWFLMWAMIRLTDWAAQLPGSWWHVRSPSPPEFAFYYALLVGVLAGGFKTPTRRWVMGAGLVALALVAAGYAWQARALPRLSILPVHGGSAIWFDAPGHRHDLLVDCGNETGAGFVVKPFLRARGVNRISRFVLTHGDLRHVGGTLMILEEFRVREVVTSPLRFRSPAYRRIQQMLEQNPARWRRVARGEQLDVWWRVLHPVPEDRFAQADDGALVLWGELPGLRCLLLSDLGHPGQELLVRRDPDALRAEVVIAGLPRQGEPLADGLLDLVQPRLIVIQDDEYPATERAPGPLLERLKRRGVPVLSTRREGQVTLEKTRRGWRARTMTGCVFELPDARRETIESRFPAGSLSSVSTTRTW